MSKARALLIVLSIFLISKSDASTKVHPISQGSAIAEKLVHGVGKITSTKLGGKLTEFLLQYFLPSNSFTITVTNNMRNSHMIDPKIYLESGKTSVPPAFRIPAAKDIGAGITQLAVLKDSPRGILCYRSQPIEGQFKDQLKETLCVIFNAYEETYCTFRTVNEMPITMTTLKSIIKMKSSQPQTKRGGFLFEWNTYTQMTTGANKQLYFEVLDNNVMGDMVMAEKRALLSMAAVSFGVGILFTLGSYITNKFIAEVGTTLTLENASSEIAPIVLIDPRWIQSGVNVLDIIPRRLSPQESCEAKFAAPFGSGKGLGSRFQKSYIVLSFLIEGTPYRLKIIFWTKPNTHMVSLERTGNPENDPNLFLQRFYQKVKNGPVKESGKYQHYSLWKFAILDANNVKKFITVVTNMGDAKQSTITVKVYTKNAPGNTPPLTGNPEPKEYTGLPDDNLPVIEEL